MGKKRKKNSKELNLSGYAASLVKVIEDAQRMGYRAYDTGHGGVQLVPKDRKLPHITVPKVRSINEARLKSIINQVIRYADQEAMDTYKAKFDELPNDEREMLKALAPLVFQGEKTHIDGVLVMAGLKSEEEYAEDDHEVKVEAVPAPVEVTVETPDDESEEEEWPKIRPYYARLHPGTAGGKRYKSPAINERVHKDGTIDYICKHPGCGFTGRKFQVTGHYAWHSRKKEANNTEPVEIIPDPDYTEVTFHKSPGEQAKDYKPTARLVEALVEYLDLNRGNQTMDSEALARMFLTWAHDRPDRDQEDMGPNDTVDQSPEAILGRIRAMVSKPMLEELQTTRRVNEALKDEVERLGVQRNWKAESEILEERIKEMQATIDAYAEQIQALQDKIKKQMDDRAALADLLRGMAE